MSVLQTIDLKKYYARFEKCRNTLCISNFSDRWIGEKCPAKAEGELCGVA